MKKAKYVIFAVVFICVFFGGCEKKADATSSQTTGLKVEASKITDDLDATFKVQAEMDKTWGRGGGDLGIVGTIESGRLTISVPDPEEDFLHNPFDVNLGSDTEGLKIAQLSISTSTEPVLLWDNSFYNDTLPGYPFHATIWFANKDGDIDCGYGAVPIKQGWNFFRGEPGFPIDTWEGTQTIYPGWTSLQEVYTNGFGWRLGYDNNQYVEEEHAPPPSDAYEIYAAISNLRLRSQPDTSVDNRITSIREGDMVLLLETGRTDTIDGKTAPWYRVSTADGIVGWVFSGYLRFVRRAQ